MDQSAIYFAHEDYGIAFLGRKAIMGHMQCIVSGHLAANFYIVGFVDWVIAAISRNENNFCYVFKYTYISVTSSQQITSSCYEQWRLGDRTPTVTVYRFLSYTRSMHTVGGY